METTVTGLFHDARAAAEAQRELESQGFSHDAIRVLTGETEHLHEVLGGETSDATRGLILGGAVGAVGAAVAGALLALPPVSLFAVAWPLVALCAALFGGVIGAAIGFLIGSATGHQVQEEYERCLENGDRLIAVNTDNAHAAEAHATLRKLGGELLSTAVHLRSHRASA
ncbi:MAG: hypothetical protein U1E73_03435 [Planctomycetota bacterium]